VIGTGLGYAPGMRAVASGVIAGVLAARTLTAAAQPTPTPAPSGAVSPSPEAAPASASPANAAPAGAAPASAAPPAQLGRHRGPWLLVGGSIAIATVGAVLAYSANAAERDVRDLYVGLNGTPPPFNAATRKLYDDAIAEGRRYQTLSIASFGLAGALAIGAAVWFALDRSEQITVAPVIAPGAAGVSTMIRF